MSPSDKFLPPDDLPRFHLPFWEALRRHEFRSQKCAGCGTLRFIPTEICARCGCRESDWALLSGKGRVHTYTVVHRGPTPAYQSDAPYVIVHVELEEGPRAISNLLGCDPREVRIGMPVEIVFEEVSEDWTLFKFVPAKA
jgi:uncharacterized OB-fold protein